MQYRVFGYSSQIYTKKLIPLVVISLIFGPFAGAATHLLMKTMLSVEFKDEPANVSLLSFWVIIEEENVVLILISVSSTHYGHGQRQVMS
jgi:hypothetical protein